MSIDTQLTTQFDQVLHHIEDAVVEFEIVEREELRSSGSRTQSGEGVPIIADANHAFRDIFSPDMKRVIGLPLNELIVPADKQAEAEGFDQRTAAGRSNVAFVERTTTDGEKTFLYRGIPADDDRGYAIYTDVTDQLQRQDALTEIIALASELSENSEARDVESTAESITELAQGVLDFSAADQSHLPDSEPSGD